MGDPTSSYATAGIALRVSGALKPHHHDKVETPSVGSIVTGDYVPERPKTNPKNMNPHKFYFLKVSNRNIKLC
jgi:hypothetical protein